MIHSYLKDCLCYLLIYLSIHINKIEFNLFKKFNIFLKKRFKFNFLKILYLKIKFYLLINFIVILLFSTAHCIQLQIEGIDNDLKNNLNTYLSNIDINNINFDFNFKKKINQIIYEGMRTLGYYTPNININIYSRTNNYPDLLIIHIDSGEPIRVADINVTLLGDSTQDKDYQKIITKSKFLLGKVLHHKDYDLLKNTLSKIALNKGYFDAEFIKNRLNISLSKKKAFWDIEFNSGKRYTFGDVNFHGSQICTYYLKNILQIYEGDSYNNEIVAIFNRRLNATNWFNSVIILPDFNNINNNKKKILLNIIVIPRIRNNIEAGIGYSSDIGSRLRLAWNQPWINIYGHSLESNISFSLIEQTVNLNYKIPFSQNPLEQYYLLQASFKREFINNNKSEFAILNLAKYWDFFENWKHAFNLHWYLNRSSKNNIYNINGLIYPGVNTSRIRQKNDLNWGDNQKYSIDISSIIWGSDTDFIILQAYNAWIRTFLDKHRFIWRGNLGWIYSNNFNYIPLTLRFFAGGDRSIRGYKYKSISPKNVNNQLIGGNKLITSSLEYQFNIFNKWWTLIFIDIGEVVNNIKINNFKIGSGIGIRWQSPLGSIKFDLATPVFNKSHDNKLQFNLGLGPEL